MVWAVGDGSGFVTEIPMNYAYWLLGISLAFAVLERLRPWRPEQPLLRGGLGRDVGFLAFNLFVLWAAVVAGAAALHATELTQRLGIRSEDALLARAPFWAQIVVLLVISDFIQWCIHNLLHRVPFLWTFHKVHHSITTMDWIGNFHFHWMEIVVYKTLQWLPLSLLGGSGSAAFVVAVLSTAWGHFNHANLNAGLGPLGYVFNSPRMHLWHHDRSTEGGTAKNFGIVLSVWDFLFRTAYWPRNRSPRGLGYPGDEAMPTNLLGQLLWPVTFRRYRERSAGPEPTAGR